MCSLVCFSQTSTKPGRKSLKNQNKKEYSLNSKGKTKGQDNFREEGYVTQGGEEEVEGEQGSKKESLELVEETCEHPQVRIGDPKGQVSWDRIQMPCFKLINTEVVASQKVYHIDVIFRSCFSSKKSQCHGSTCCPLYNSLTFVSFLGKFHQALISSKKSGFCFYSIGSWENFGKGLSLAQWLMSVLWQL